MARCTTYHRYPVSAVLFLGYWLFGPIPAQAQQPPAIRIIRDVKYQFDEPRQCADVYLPTQSEKTSPSPAVIWMHGNHHDKADAREREVCSTLAGAGYVAVTINYGTWPDSDSDEEHLPRILQNTVNARNAIRFFRLHAADYAIDPRRIALFGGSAGAWLALNVGLSDGDAAFDAAPPYAGVSSAVSAIGDFYGDTDAWIKSKINAHSPPLLIIHGKADPAVDYHESVELAQLLEAANVPRQLILLDGVGHGFDFTSWQNKPLPQDLRPIVLEFLKTHLISVDPAAAPPQPLQIPATGKGYGPARTQQPILPAVPLAGFEFHHPMTVLNASELSEVKRRIAAHVEPQATAFTELVKDADALADFQPDPPDIMNIMGGYEPGTNQDTIIRPWLWRNCHAAYASTLAYTYTGQTKYADKAVTILNAWAQKGTEFVGGDRGLQLGSWFSPMLFAADLLHDYPGWKPADRERFNLWWRTNCLPYTIEVMHEHSNNWKDACILGVMSASILLEDKSLMSDALAELQSYFQDRSDSHVTIKGAWKIQSDARGVFLPQEVTRNKGLNGVSYTAYSLTTMVEALDIARYTGHNYWHRRTPEGADLQSVIEWYFRWDIQKKPFPWNANPDHFDTRQNVYELANNHFTVMPEISQWLSSNRPVNGVQGDEYATLNKGDIPAPDKP